MGLKLSSRTALSSSSSTTPTRSSSRSSLRQPLATSRRNTSVKELNGPRCQFFSSTFQFYLTLHFSLLLSHFAFQFHFSFLFSLSSALLIQVGFFTNSVICQLVDQGSLGLLSLLDEASNRFSNASPTASTDQVQLIYTNTNTNKTQIQNKYKVKDSTDLTARSKSQYSLWFFCWKEKCVKFKIQAFLDAASVALASHPHFEAEGKAGGNPVPAHSFRWNTLPVPLPWKKYLYHVRCTCTM